MFEKLEKSPKPVVAAISGSCLGGGLEVWMSPRAVEMPSHSLGGCAAVNLGLLFLLQESLPSRIGLILAIKHLHGVNS